MNKQNSDEVSNVILTIQKWQRDSEELEALHRNLDKSEIPRNDSLGVEYSAWGRIVQFARNTKPVSILREIFSDRDLFLMREAHKAAQYYESIDAWLDTPVGDDGHVVGHELAHFVNERENSKPDEDKV